MSSHHNIISLAYYLPQFHEIEENNRWWGQGFTEWSQLRQAKQYFKWQKIRKPIAPLNEYSLLQPRIMELQSQIAKQHAINAFLVFDYWFGNGKTLLEKPMQMVLDQQLNFDYCLCWANHTWYNKRDNITLLQQQYLGEDDYKAYFKRLLPHFQSSHYIKIDNQPIFSIFNPNEIPDLETFISTFQSMAKQAGFNGIYMIADNTDASSNHAALFNNYTRSNHLFKKRNRDNLLSYFKEKLTRKFGYKNIGPFYYSYPNLVVDQYTERNDIKYAPTVFTGWDTTPRHLRRGTVLKDFSLDSFQQHLTKIEQSIRLNKQRGIKHQLIIIKSWNEWAEGNLLEPDSVFGDSLLRAFHSFISRLK
jgi:hypothetical protein